MRPLSSGSAAPFAEHARRMLAVTTERRALQWLLLLLALLLLTADCNREANRASEKFLQALARDDYDAAFVELHPDALASTPTVAALRDRMTNGSVKLQSWSSTCGSTGSTVRIGDNVTSSNRRGAASARPITVGVTPDLKSRCNGPMLVELRRQTESPDAPWKVRSFHS